MELQIEDFVLPVILFIIMCIGIYVSDKRIGAIVKNNKFQLKETSYYELGRKYVEYRKHRKHIKNHSDISLIERLQKDIEEDVKILLEKNG